MSSSPAWTGLIRLDDLWRKEVQDRIRAHAAGELGSVPLEKVLEKYRK